MSSRKPKERSHLDIVVEMLRGCGDGGATFKEIVAATKLTRDDVWTAFRNAEEDRIENEGERLWLSKYERAGLHPNAGEVMAWLNDRPLPRQYIEEDRPEMQAALKQLIRRGLVRAIGGACGACHRTDRPLHSERAKKLARVGRALARIDPKDRDVVDFVC